MSDPARQHAQRITMLTEDDVRQMVRDDMPIAGCETQQQWARKNGMSPQYLSDFMSGRRGPGPLILKALLLKRTVVYEAADA